MGVSGQPMSSSISASAVAKLIIAGEHAVVYRRPALAVPLPDVTAAAHITTAPHGHGCWLEAPDLNQRGRVGVDEHPLIDLITDLLTAWHLPTPDLTVTIHSGIPIASGMGSGAAVATALVRAFAAWCHKSLSRDQLGAFVYRSEQRLHGTPSGIDNTVIAYDQPISFCRQAPLADGTAQPPRIVPLGIGAPITLVIADSGERSPTHLAVGGVRQRREQATAHYDALFDAIGAVTLVAQQALATGDAPLLGAVCRQNHTLLQQIGVSAPTLDALVTAAVHAGAYGAKLSGAGVGGIMFAVCPPDRSAVIQQALMGAGAVKTFTTQLQPYHSAK
jgi:mevalonate kinase